MLKWLTDREVARTSSGARFSLRLHNVTKKFESESQEVDAVGPVSLDIKEGEFLVLFGPSGCGKSTLLNMIAGFDSPSSGDITFFGKPITHPGPDRLMMFQDHALFPWLSVFDNVIYGLKNKHWLGWKARRETVRHFLRMVHLEQFEKSLIHELSGGMRHRVALARALAPDPEMLLIDEPFPALDALTRVKLYGELQEIFTRTKKTIISVTHDMREAACLGDRVIVFSPRPGTVRAEINVDLPRPRDITDPKVAEYAGRIMAQLTIK